MSDSNPAVTGLLPEAEAHFDLLARRAGLEVPAERRHGAITAYIDLIRTARLLHVSRRPDQWTSHVYRVDTITAAKDEHK